MGIAISSDAISFADESIKQAWNTILKTDSELAKHLERAKKDIKENAFCGIQIPKKLIPKEYKRKFGDLENLWKYNLPDAWRLLYTITTPDKIEIISVILDWVDHKEYNRIFKY